MKTIILYLVICFYSFSFAQTQIKISSIDSGGDTFNSDGISMISTIGEVAVNEFRVNSLRFSEGFLGKEQFSISNNVLSCIDVPSNLVSWWTGNNTTQDALGSNHGTAQGGVSYVTGTVNNAFYFDGIDDVIVVPHSNNLDITGDVTIELWVRRVGYANQSQTVICKGAGWIPNDEPVVFSMRFENDLTEFLFEDVNENNIIVNGPAYEDSQWHHYAYVRQGNSHIVYADGFDFGWNSFTNPPASTTGLPLTIGGQYHNPTNSVNDYDNFFNGEVDEVGVYNRALSATEIQSIFNAGSDGKCNNALSIEGELIAENKAEIYPNPVKSKLTIKLNHENKNVSLELFDVLGKRVKVVENLSSNQTEINVSTFKSGLYFYLIKSKNDVLKSGKLVKH